MGEVPGEALNQPLTTAAEARLDPAVRPLAYRLDLTIDPAKDRFSGSAEIELDLQQPAPALRLHGRGLTVTAVSASFAGRTVPGQWQQETPSGGARITFAEALPAGPVTLSLAYSAPLGDSAAGLFRVKVGDDWFVWSQFEAIEARAAFPCFDEPGFKAPFTVVLRTPPGLRAISNAPQVSVTRENGLDVHRFARTLPLPSYLVAIMAGPFTGVSGEVPPTPQRGTPLPLRIVASRATPDRLAFALEGSQEIVTRLEDWFGEPFPFPKLDQITTPILPGAMENAGADLYQDGLLLVGKDSPVAARRRFGMIVAHELSHQWFGDLVTPVWWTDLWLNESFANWMGYHIGHAWEPDLNIAPGALAEGYTAMATDALTAGRPIRQPIVRDSQIDGAFDSITYGKGSHVITMFAAFIGEERFQRGVRSYIAAHHHSNASSDDFFRALAEAAGDPAIVPAMQSFVDQQGVPLLTFTRHGKDYLVTQSRYAPLGSTPPPFRWAVPMCVRRAMTRLCHLLETPRARIILPGKDRLVPNAGGTGYYRFELGDEDWERLIKSAGSLPTGEALAVADSLEASFLAGRSNVKRLADLARELAHHRDSQVSARAFDAMSGLAVAGLIEPAAQHAYQRFARKLYLPVLEDLGLDPRRGAYVRERSETSEKRAQAVRRLANSARDGRTITVLANAAKAYLAGDEAALDPAWYDLALPIHVLQGGAPAARALVEKALVSPDADFRAAALAAAARGGKEETARWLLDELQDQRLRGNERGEFLLGVVETPATRNFGYAWLKAHLDTVLDGAVGVFFAARTPQMLASFCSGEEADAMVRELRPRFAGKPAELELERAIERVRNCGVLRAARKAEVSEAVMRLN